MAQVDASIPLQVQQPQILNPMQAAQFRNQLYRMQLDQLQVQEAQRQAQSKNSLTQIFQEPGATGDDGMPTQNTLNKVMAIDPEVGMNLQNNLVRMQEQREAMASRRITAFLASMQINDAQHAALEKMETGLQARYDELIDSGTTKAEAIKIVSAEKVKGREELRKSGYLTKEQVDQISGTFDPEGNKAFLAASPEYKRYLDERRQAREQKTKEKAEEETPYIKEKKAELKAAGMKEGTPEYQKELQYGLRKRTKREEAPTAPMLIQAAPPTSADAIELAAQQYLKTGQMPAMGMADRTTRGRILEKAAQIAKANGQSLADVPAARVEFKALEKAIADRTKFFATVSQFVNNFDKQVALVEKYATSGAANYNAAINKWVQNGRKALENDPSDVVALDTAIRGAAREHQRIVTGVTSNAQLLATAATTADELLNKAMTPKAIAAALKVMKEESKNLREAGRLELQDLKKQLSNVGKVAPGIDAEVKSYKPSGKSGVSVDQEDEKIKALLDKYK